MEEFLGQETTVGESFTEEPMEEMVGRGVYLRVGGRWHIDCSSGTFNLPLGYSHERLRAALHAQLDRTAHLSSEFTRARSREIFERQFRELLPAHINAFRFRDVIGSTATEGAIKTVQKATGRSGIVSLGKSHHGQSIGATGVSGNAFRQRNFRLPFVDSLKIPAPECSDCFYRQSPDTCGMLCAERLEYFLEFLSNGQVAAVIVEPVLGNGGNIVPPPDWFPTLRKVCNRHDILIIADEVQTGFGRTGTFFATGPGGFAEALEPDIIVFAKGAGGIGIPVAGFLMRGDLDVLEPWEHSTTSGANPPALVALETTIKVIKDEGLLENAQAMGKVLKDGLRELERRHQMVTNVKGEGLMLAFDLPTSSDVAAFIALGKANGLLLRGSRYGFGNTVKVRPPLIIAQSEAHAVLRGLDAALTQLERN